MLFLGGVEFTDFELPETIDQGGQQELSVHKLIGGKRVIDAMGPDDASIEWKGRLLGQTAQLRALRLDLLRRSGKEVELSFGIRAYRVVVKSFQAQLERPYLLSYSISVEIIEDLVAGTGGADSRSIEAQVEEDLAAAETIAAEELALLAAIQTVRGLISGRLTPGTLLRSAGMLALADFQGAVGEAIGEATGSALIADTAVGLVSAPVASALANQSGTLITTGAAAGTTAGPSEAQVSVPASFAGVVAGGAAGAMAASLLSTSAAADTGYAAHGVENYMTRVHNNLSEVPP